MAHVDVKRQNTIFSIILIGILNYKQTNLTGAENSSDMSYGRS